LATQTNCSRCHGSCQELRPERAVVVVVVDVVVGVEAAVEVAVEAAVEVAVGAAEGSAPVVVVAADVADREVEADFNSMDTRIWHA
jgi:hypothetical protein